jgi:hypothetical protein
MKYLLKVITLCAYLFIAFVSLPALSKDNNRFVINTGSFLYHLYNPNDTKYTELFDNKFLSVGVRINDSSHIIAGSFLNSYGNRCALLGLEKNWYNFNDKLSFKGGYAYAGDFFFDSLDHCGDQGMYKRIEELTGIGFAPYIYHGISYDITSIMSFEAGLILPGLAVASIQWKF